jgi:ElaB/YqjD/DUF883 family membrane-anchored ribosome-binding protein
MKNSGAAVKMAREVRSRAADISVIPVQIAGEVRRTVESAYEDVSRGVRRAKHSAEDMIEDSRHEIKRHPFAAVAIAGGSGLLIGFAFGCLLGYKTAPRKRM